MYSAFWNNGSIYFGSLNMFRRLIIIIIIIIIIEVYQKYKLLFCLTLLINFHIILCQFPLFFFHQYLFAIWSDLVAFNVTPSSKGP